MGEKLSITIRIAGREYPVRVPPEEEYFLREAARQINERMKLYRDQGWHDDQSVLAMVAMESVVARLKGEDMTNQLQQVIGDRLGRLNRLVDPVIPH